MRIVKAPEFMAVFKKQCQRPLARTLDANDGLTEQLHEVRVRGWDKSHRGANRAGVNSIRIATLDGDPNLGVEMERDLILVETDLLQPASDQKLTVKFRWQTMHRYFGTYPGGNGMCVSGLLPGFMVEGSIGCQLPSGIGFSILQYPSG